MPSSVPVSSLREHLLTALLAVPGSRTFHLHVLVSTFRKPAQSLFLYADARPKCFVQDVLVLLSEETSKTGVDDPASVNPVVPDVSTDLAPRIFVSAIEASVFAFPMSSSTILYISKVDGTGQGAYPSPTSTLLRAFLVFYASPQSPLNASSTTPHNLWIHLFARSQRQYLFPNSADHPKKKPLGDIALCKWWKKMLGDVAKAVEDETVIAVDSNDVALKAPAHYIRLYYVLPGQTESEASYMLGNSQSFSTSPQTHWIYSHPYDLHLEAGIPVPSGMTSMPTTEHGETPKLAHLIPHFEDDPKSRFLDELAATSEEQAVAVPVPTPRRKRQRTDKGDGNMNSTLSCEGIDKRILDPSSDATKDQRGDRTGVAVATETPPLPGPTIKYIPPSSSPQHARSPSPPPRPSTPDPTHFPQSTMLSPQTPNLPTFPASLLSPHTPPPNCNRQARDTLDPHTPFPHSFPRSPRTPHTPRRPKSDLDTISPMEFWERMSFRQECALGAVTGFFVAIFLRRASTSQDDRHIDGLPPSSITASDGTSSGVVNDTPPTLLSPGTIPHSVLKRVMSSLLTGVEFSTAERSQKGTSVIESAIKGLCQGLGEVHSVNRESAADYLKTADATEDSKKQDPTPDVYAAHIYAPLSTSNPPLIRSSGGPTGSTSSGVTPTINVLGVRRKKKRE